MKSSAFRNWGMLAAILIANLGFAPIAKADHHHRCSCSNSGTLFRDGQTMAMISVSREGRNCQEAYSEVQRAISSSSQGLITCPNSVPQSGDTPGYTCTINCQN